MGYFFLFYRFESVTLRKVILIFYQLILCAFIMGGLACLVAQSNSKCSGTGYGGMNIFMALLEIISGLLLLIGNIVLSSRYSSG